MSETTGDPKEIDVQKRGDISRMMPPEGGRRQSMRGFEARFVDIVDYIVRITHEIWEEKGVGLIDDYYQHNTKVHTPYGLVYGRDAVVAGTLSTLAALPDRRLYADDVIWAGDDEAGFKTSHRIMTVAHHTGYGPYGPPTGRQVSYWGIADCRVKENRVYEEWLVRDEMSLILQLGLDPHRLARERAARMPAPPVPGRDIDRAVGQLPPPESPPIPDGAGEVEVLVRRAFHDLWNRRLLNRVGDYYDERVEVHAPAGRELIGRADLVGWIIALLAAFPDAKLQVDDLTWLGDEDKRYRVATRWSLIGTHLGHGLYGPPTGAPVRIMGISHQVIRDGRCREEWMVFDEFALLCQLVRGGAAGRSSDGDDLMGEEE